MIVCGFVFEPVPRLNYPLRWTTPWICASPSSCGFSVKTILVPFLIFFFIGFSTNGGITFYLRPPEAWHWIPRTTRLVYFSHRLSRLQPSMINQGNGCYVMVRVMSRAHESTWLVCQLAKFWHWACQNHTVTCANITRPWNYVVSPRHPPIHTSHASARRGNVRLQNFA